MLLECSVTKVYKSSIDFSSDISQQKGMILFISLIVSSDSSEVAIPITCIQLSAKVVAIFFPIPLDAPVTTAVLFEYLNI